MLLLLLSLLPLTAMVFACSSKKPSSESTGRRNADCKETVRRSKEPNQRSDRKVTSKTNSKTTTMSTETVRGSSAEGKDRNEPTKTKEEDSFDKMQPEKKEAARAATIRGCLVPNEGDYKTWHDKMPATSDFSKSIPLNEGK